MIDRSATRWRWYMDGAGGGLCLAATLVFYVFGISPLMRKHASLETHQASLSAQQLIVSGLANKLAMEKDNFAQAKKTLAESPFQLASSASVNHRIGRMTELASKCGLKLDQIRPGTPAVGARYETIPIYLTGVGNYRTCVLLLYRLRRSFPDTTVMSLELSRDTADPQAGAQFSVSLLWYTSPASQASM